MPDDQIDVDKDQNSSTGQDAQEASSASADDSTASSAQTTPGPVPYDRFKDVNDQKNIAMTELEAAQARIAELETPEPETEPTPDEFLESLRGQPADTSQDPSNPQAVMDQWNEQLRDGLENNPGMTLQNFVSSMIQQGINQNEQNERQARKVVGFDEKAYNEIEDAVVIAAQNNPKLIRAFIAAQIKARKKDNGNEQVKVQLQTQASQPADNISVDAVPVTQPQSAKEKYELDLKEKGVAEYLAQQKAGSLSSESSATSAETESGEPLELEASGTEMFKHLGVDPKKGAARLNKILGG